MDPGRETLIFDGSLPNSPCFFKPIVPTAAPFDPSNVPDSYLRFQTDNPHNDAINLAKTQILSAKLPRGFIPPAPGSCTVSPQGFVCGPLSVPNGTVAKCVPRMDQSDLNQLSARVLPLSVNRANGSLDNPARADPRFFLFPRDYPPAYSRGCMGKMSSPLDMQPLPCGAKAEAGMRDRLVPHTHKVDAMDLGFRSNSAQMTQLKASKMQADMKRMRHISGANGRAGLWKQEALNIRTSSADGMIPIFLFERRQVIINFL